MKILVLVAGILILLGLATLLSENRKAIRLRTVILAFTLQAGIALFILFVPTGQQVLLSLSNGVSHILSYADAGINFLFGDLATKSGGFIFAIKVLPVIVFSSALMSVLYYLRIMQFIVVAVGSLLNKLLGTSRAESMAATANIFIGNSDVFILMKPYAPRMTRSELFALMTGGLASIAGSVMLGYASMGINIEYLLAAAFMSAPGGLLMAKLICPEQERPDEITQDRLVTGQENASNLIEAITQGASTGLKLALSVGAMLLVFVSLIDLCNGLLGGVGAWFGLPDISLQLVFGYLFSPFAWLLGIDSQDVMTVANLLGQKLVLNEFVAYMQLTQSPHALSDYSEMVTVIALAGFANFASPAVLIGVLATFVPEKKNFISNVTWKVIVAGLFANLMSAALAGLFYQLDQLITMST